MISRRVHRTVDHVWTEDPALDKEAEGFAAKWRKFLETGNVDELPLKNGQRPTVFRLASLKREAVLQLSDIVHADVKSLVRAGNDRVIGLAFFRSFEAAVSRGLVGVQNFTDDAGRPVSLRFDDDGLVHKETLEDLLYPELMRELGLRILEISMPGPTRGQG